MFACDSSRVEILCFSLVLVSVALKPITSGAASHFISSCLSQIFSCATQCALSETASSLLSLRVNTILATFHVATNCSQQTSLHASSCCLWESARLVQLFTPLVHTLLGLSCFSFSNVSTRCAHFVVFVHPASTLCTSKLWFFVSEIFNLYFFKKLHAHFFTPAFSKKWLFTFSFFTPAFSKFKSFTLSFLLPLFLKFTLDFSKNKSFTLSFLLPLFQKVSFYFFVFLLPLLQVLQNFCAKNYSCNFKNLLKFFQNLKASSSLFYSRFCEFCKFNLQKITLVIFKNYLRFVKFSLHVVAIFTLVILKIYSCKFRFLLALCSIFFKFSFVFHFNFCRFCFIFV